MKKMLKKGLKIQNEFLRILLVCCILALSVCGVKAEAAQDRTEPAAFYVDGDNGDDNADGTTPETAWKTLERLQEAGPFLPGDQILLKAGTEYHEAIQFEGSGSEEAPITVDIYDGTVIGKEAGERAAIHADGQAASAVLLEDVSYWHVSNLEISNDAGNNDERRVGFNVEISEPGVQKGFHLDNLYVHDVTGTMTNKDEKNGGIFFAVICPTNVMGSTPTHFEDILIENCYVKDVSRTGMSIGYTTKDADSYGYGGNLPDDFIEKYYHTNVVIRNNYVERSGGDAIVPMYCNKPLIEYNVSDGASQNTDANPNAMYNAAIWPWRCEDAIFQYNEAFGTILNGDGQAFDCDFSRRTIYQYNYSHDNEGGFMLVCQAESLDSVVRYNISQNDMRNLFMLSNADEAVFYNNTFYIGAGLNGIVSDYGGKASMYNNIFYSTGESNIGTWGNNVKYDNNLYYQCNTLPNDANKIDADPKFTDPGKGGVGELGNSAIDTLSGYQLQEDSPAIDAGKEIADNGGRDYFGNPIDGATDIGAAEYYVAYTVNAYVDGKGGTITPEGELLVKEGESQKFVVTPDQGYGVKDITVNGKSMGKLSEFTVRNITKDTTVVVTFQKKIVNPFKDVSKADYFYQAVLWALENEVTGGRTADTFAPYAECSRADIVTFLYRALNGSVTETECTFKDVNPADYYYDAMLWAVAEGITTGRDAETFAPYAECSRADFVTFFWRAMGKEAVEAEENFEDVAPEDYFYEAVLWAVENNITQGLNESSFGSYHPCYRGDAVTFIQRALGK